MENEPVTLGHLLGLVRSAVKTGVPGANWVIGEISELKVNYSGHCYLELIEKEPEGDGIRAKARATIWASTFRLIQPYFETTTQTRLAAGLKVLVKVTAEFHELYGFSLNITDIEPSFTMGEMARQKQEIINRLVAEGVFDMNKQISFPELPQRVAVVSSRTAAGLGDFLDQLVHNSYGYKFYPKLFPAIMQGEEAEQSIIQALDRVFAHESQFDLVVIIRGGGAQSELQCFNSYWLAFHICQFPLPVLTGIGHEQDETIADLVAHRRLKTPTAVAEFLIGQFRMADDKINALSLSLTGSVTERMDNEHDRLNRMLLLMKPSLTGYLQTARSKADLLRVHLSRKANNQLLQEKALLNRREGHLSRITHQHWLTASHRIAMKSQRIKELCRTYLSVHQHSLDLLEKKKTYLDPFLILRRGYSVTYYQGKAVKDPSAVPSQAEIESRLAGGLLKSKTT